MATYVLLDGHSLAYRAWFALQEAGMKTSSGQETQAVYGFVAMTTKLLGDLHPDGMAVAFDRSEPTFRDGLDADYKAGRPPMPEPLRQQIGLVQELVAALGVPGIDAVGYEADDVIATMATRLAGRGDDVVIVTGDRDAFQLVEDPHVKVLYNRRGVTDYVLYDEAGIVERTGVAPAQYPLLAALRGDPSDNIPGVPGVGDKTAAKLVTAYGDLDGIYANLELCTPKLRASLASFEARVRLNLTLTPAVRDVPLDVDLDTLSLGREDREGLSRFFGLLEMRNPHDRLLGVLDGLSARRGEAVGPGSGSGPGPGGGKVDPAPSPESLPVVAFDREGALAWLNGTGLAQSRPERGVQVVAEPSWSGAPGRSGLAGIALLEVGAAEVVWLGGPVLEDPDVVDGLCRLLAGAGLFPLATRGVLAHRAKELMRFLLPLGIDLTNLQLDTAVAAYLVDPSDGQASLDLLARRAGLGELLTGAPEGRGGQLGFDLDGDGAGGGPQASGHRAEVIAALAAQLAPALEEAGATALWEEVERPLVRVLARMEVAGIAVDTDRLRSINEELTAEARALEAEIQALAGEPFNVNSTIQLRTVLYERLGLRPQRKTKTGYSTDAATLEKLRAEHPVVEMLLRYREVEKLRSTYGDGLLAEVGLDGRIHASFNQTVARTGRLSSDQPNLHNIPVRTVEGRRFREAFVARPGCSLLVADYNQIELRVIAHLASDPGLVEAFSVGRDIHSTTAAGVFGVPIGEVTPAMRAKAKMVSYGLAYGMEAYGLAQRLAISVEEAGVILARYFAAFPAVRAYMEDTVVEARRRGYTETALGRRRYLPELASDNFRVRQAAERQAMNAGIQGLAADIFKVSLVRLDRAIEDLDLSARLVLQVHDEILVEVPKDERDQVEELTLEVMQGAFPLSVPLEVNLAWGATWADAKHS